MLIKLLGVVVIAYLIIVTILWGAQERMVLPGPSRPLPQPKAFGFDDGERVTVVADDGTELHGWYLPPEPNRSEPAPGLLWFYGNMETVSVLGDLFSVLKPPGAGLLVLDYRGYGDNPGRATEQNIERDGEAAMEYLRSRPDIDPAKIAVYGRSIGSTVAMHVATKYPVSAVVLDSPMSTAADVAAEHYWFFPRFLVRLELDNVGRAASLDAPLLVVHGEKDRIIPSWMGREVADAAAHGRFVLLGNAGHNSTYATNPEFYREVVWQQLGFDGSGETLRQEDRGS